MSATLSWWRHYPNDVGARPSWRQRCTSRSRSGGGRRSRKRGRSISTGDAVPSFPWLRDETAVTVVPVPPSFPPDRKEGMKLGRGIARARSTGKNGWGIACDMSLEMSHSETYQQFKCAWAESIVGTTVATVVWSRVVYPMIHDDVECTRDCDNCITIE